jgi:geranylgeranyl diphosphate synthase type I
MRDVVTRSTNQDTAATAIDALHREAGALIDRELPPLLDELEGAAPLLRRMCAYHLGMADAEGNPMPAERRALVQGKRMRPQLALLCCAAAGGAMADAAPLAAAIELLHNFTLVHDDIQDRSPNRRHRPTVWRLWGDAQAINAGDALFAAAQIGVLNSRSPAVGPDGVLEIARAFNRMTIDIVRGQVLDLGFEGERDVSPEAYLEMIGGKTAAIVRFAAWAGALLGGASDAVATHFGAFGEALGMGFQLRDDALGIWGAAEDTGKDAADDIRRRKQSLPVLLLRRAAVDADRAELDRIFAAPSVPEADVELVLTLLARYRIADEVAARVRAAHDTAVTELDALPPGADPTAIVALRALIDRMAARTA